MAHEDRTPRAADTPTPGFYRVRMVKGGPWVPARIMHEDGMWLVLIDGEPTASVAMADPWKVPRMEWVAFANRLDEGQYRALLEARRALPDDHPLKDPRRPVSLRAADSLYVKRKP